MDAHNPLNFGKRKMMRLYTAPLFLFVLLLLSGCESGSSGGSGENGGGGEAGGDQQDIVLMPGQSGPIEFSHIRMEFNPVTAGDTVIASYPFKNTSQRTVTIDNVITSCHCLTAEFPKQKLIPGEIGEIKVYFATEGQAREVPTTHEKMFPVQVDGQLEPLETLRLVGQVLPKTQ